MRSISKWLGQQEHYPAIGVLLGGLLGRGVIATGLPPGFDEAYYYLYSQHLDWSFFDHPLLVALSTGLGVWSTGQVSQLTIRLGALGLHTGALALLYATGLRLFSRPAALLTLAIASLVPIFQLGFGVLTLPDAPLMFFWTAALYVASREFFPPVPQEEAGDRTSAGDVSGDAYRPSYRLALIGLLVGLACLSKYHGLALGFGLVGFCLTSLRHRRALRSPWTLAALGLFLLAILPIVIWNGQHDWVSLRFQSGRAVPDRGYSLGDLLVAFLVGVAYLFPTFGFPLWWTSGRAVWRQVQGKLAQTTQFEDVVEHRLKIRLILWTALPLMLVFTLMGGYRPILPTWPAPGFWSATLLLGQRAAEWQQRSRRRVQRWLWGSGWVIATLLTIALLHVTLGLFQKPSQYAVLGGWIPAQADASVQLLDIQQLRTTWRNSTTLQAALQENDFLFTNEIYLAGQLGMAIAPLTAKPVTCFDADLRGFAFWSTPQQWVGKNGLLVTAERQGQPDLSAYTPYFQQIQKLADIPIWRGGAIVQRLQVYQATHLLKPYPRPYGN